MFDETVGQAQVQECHGQARRSQAFAHGGPGPARDAALFDQPDRVILDREVNRHFAFGVGIHRCLGSNLARMELRVTIQTWLRRIPDFTLTDPDAVTWSAGQVRGPRTLPLAFPPA